MINKIKPRMYQLEGSFWLAKRGGLLSWSVGLGKTYGALLAIQNIKAVKTLIICPKSLRLQWASEIQKFDPGAYRIEEVNGTTVVSNLTANRYYTLTHYEQYINRAKTGEIMQCIKWDAVVIDEVHNISNRNAQRTKNIKRLKTTFKIGLTGTPIRERPDQLWSILNWLDPKEFSSYWTFVRLYCQIDTEYNNQGSFESIKGIKYLPNEQGIMTKDITLKLLQDRVANHLLVKRLEDVGLELPPLTVTDVPIEMNADQRRFYQQVKRQVIVELGQELGSKNPQVWDLTSNSQLIIRSAGARFTRLQQVASAPSVFTVGSNAKVEWLIDYVNGNGEPGVILTRFNHSVHIIKETLRALGVAEQYKVGTYGTLSTGHNLQHYRVLIAWDAPESRLTWEQAVGRVRRMGQEQPQQVYRLACQGTVDEHCWSLIDDKQEDVDIILEWLRGLRAL